MIRVRMALPLLVLLAAACDDGPTKPRPPASVVPVAGDGQQAVAGAPLAAPIVVRVEDAAGRPVEGATVQWQVTQGAGSLSAATSSTDEEGRAQVTWTLGTAAGENRVSATVAPLDPVVFQATAVAGPVAALTRISGEGQSVLPDSTLPAPAVVLVADSHGNPIAGASVTWTVTAGGGSVTPSSSTTDAQGQASAVWTLGPAPGGNTLRASVGGVSVDFSATAQPFPATVDLVRVVPARNGRLYADSAIVLASATGEGVYGTIRTAIAGRSVPMDQVGGPMSTEYRAVVPLTGLQVGPTYVVVRATSGGFTASDSLAVIIDRAPTLTVSAPADASVTTDGQVRVTAACNDDLPSGCVGMGVSLDGNVLFQKSAASIDTVITIPAPSSTTDYRLQVSATDLAGSTAQVERVVRYSVTPTPRVLVQIVNVPAFNSRIYADSVQVVGATASSPFGAIATVSASIAGRTAPLSGPTFHPKWGDTYWNGTVSLAGAPLGATSVIVTAVDVHGNVGADTIPVVIDEPPTLTVLSPAEGQQSDGSVRLQATCQEVTPDTCVRLYVVLGTTVLAESATGALDTTVLLPVGTTGTVKLRFTAVDNWGLRRFVERTITVQ